MEFENCKKINRPFQNLKLDKMIEKNKSELFFYKQYFWKQTKKLTNTVRTI